MAPVVSCIEESGVFRSCEILDTKSRFMRSSSSSRSVIVLKSRVAKRVGRGLRRAPLVAQRLDEGSLAFSEPKRIQTAKLGVVGGHRLAGLREVLRFGGDAVLPHFVGCFGESSRLNRRDGSEP